MHLSAVLLVFALTACAASAPRPGGGTARRPNVVIIITDDQGYGDLGANGNTHIRTPNLDALAVGSVRFEPFYVSPVCSPTRASLMTGRYNYRTGVVDTFLGRSLMFPDEVTLAEMLAAAGYRTGIFGKWHLGDNHPLRAMDQGFEESLVLKGGGIGQPSDPPGGDHYTDPTLLRNGRPIKTRGYCTDVFTDAALDFVTRRRREPFFLYLAYNAPHTPLEIPERYRKPYADAGLPDGTARTYGMITNIDDNVGRLLRRLDDLDLARDTLVVFLTDNGASGERFGAGLRGRKGSLFDGGIRVPGFFRWPAGFRGGLTVDRIAAHIDVTPTVLEAAGLAPPAGVALDGRSLLPLLRGDKVAWADRELFFQWHRGDQPQLFRSFAVRAQRFKLVAPQGAGSEPAPAPMLFDMAADPGEQTDVAAAHPEVAASLRESYHRWFEGVRATRGWDPPRIHVGAAAEDPVLLTRQDWRGPAAGSASGNGWTPEGLGHWEVTVLPPGRFTVTLRFAPTSAAGTVHLALGAFAATQPVAAGATQATFSDVSLPLGPGRLAPRVEVAGTSVGVHYAEIARSP